MMRYKGVYRLKAPYDLCTNQFPRKLNGTLEDCDVYIDCQFGNQIYHYKQSILQAYIPSIIRGHNILKQIECDGNKDIVLNIIESDIEILFTFQSKYIEYIAGLLKAKTSGANISPFSSRNLPKNKTFTIPDEELVKYKNIVQNIPKERILSITHMTNSYLKSLCNRKHKWEYLKADMALKGLKGKEYIYSINKWEDYIKFLEKNLKKGLIET